MTISFPRIAWFSGRIEFIADVDGVIYNCTYYMCDSSDTLERDGWKGKSALNAHITTAVLAYMTSVLASRK